MDQRFKTVNWNAEYLKIPLNWTVSTIEEVGKDFGDAPFGSDLKSKDYRSGGIPVIQGRNIKQNKFGWKTKLYVTNKKFESIPRSHCKTGDLIFQKIGTLGIVAILPEIEGGHEFLLSTNMMKMSADSRMIDTKYVYYYFCSDKIRNLILKNASGTSQPIFNFTTFKKFIIFYPSLKEQQLIVSKLEELLTKLDAAIDALRNTRLLLKQYRLSLLRYAFEGKLTENWRNNLHEKLEPASVLLDQIKEEKKNTKAKCSITIKFADLYKLPEGWIWTTIGNIAKSLKNGIYKPPQFYNETGIACLRMYNIDEGQLVWKNIKRMNLTKQEVLEYELEYGDVLINRVNSRELVGKAATIPDGLERCVYESKNIRLRLFQEYIDSKLVSFWFQIFAHQFFNRNAQQTVGMASINQEQVTSMPIPLPPLQDQRRIIEELENRFSIVEYTKMTIEQTLVKSMNLRQSILRAAFEGKLVPQISNDEDASLIKRIKEEKSRSESKLKVSRQKNKFAGVRSRLI